MPPIHETEIDGVVTYWADVDGPRVGAIQFGVGRAAEPAAMGGVTHLVEHLALAPLTQQEYPHNGFVTGWRTVIHATGTDEELGSFFTRHIDGLSRHSCRAGRAARFHRAAGLVAL